VQPSAAILSFTTNLTNLTNKSDKIPFESQKILPILYDGIPLKQYYQADFVCFGEIVVEINNPAAEP
jgi:GxxExxY protein